MIPPSLKLECLICDSDQYAIVEVGQRFQGTFVELCQDSCYFTQVGNGKSILIICASEYLTCLCVELVFDSSSFVRY